MDLGKGQTVSLTPDMVFHVGGVYDGMGLFLSAADVFLSAGRIAGIYAAADRSPEAEGLRAQALQARHVHLPDSLLLPGLINSHHHFYSTFARGLNSGGPMADFPAILNQLWWRLDRALDLEAVALSAKVAIVEGLKHGCTRIIDHHSSPHAVRGSLKALAREARSLHVTSVLCFEISDRNSPKVFEAALAENLDFYEAHAADTHCRGMLGLHASFTLSDRSLTRLAKAKPAELPVHVHVAEDRCDVDHAQAQGFSGPLARLDAYGLISAQSLLVHGVHLSEGELETVRSSGARVAHNPESNCNNRVGYGDPAKFRADRVLLGTDGMNSNMLGALRFAYFLNSALGEDHDGALQRFEKMLFGNPAAYLSELFGHEVGTLRAGAAADFAIFPYVTPTPLHAGNVMGHIVYALSGNSEARWVYANGEAVVEEGRLVVVNETDLYAEARQCAARVWERFANLPV